MTQSLPKINGHTHLISLLGKPVRHSSSPAMHTFAFKETGVDSIFVAFDVASEDLPEILSAMRRMNGWDGSSVTMPCKQAIIPLLDGLSTSAELAGAVNVIKKTSDNKLIGYNSDGMGFMRGLKRHNVDIENSVLTLLGPGGAGSAIFVQAALDGVPEIHLFARKGGSSYSHVLKMLEPIKEKTGCNIQLHPFEDKSVLAETIKKSDILVNATNIGMGENNEETPIPDDLIKSGMVVADVIYFPRKTKLLEIADAKNCKIITGMEMLIGQAVEAEKIWYDVDMPLDKIHALFR